MTNNIETSLEALPVFSVLQENISNAIKGLYKSIDRHSRVYSQIAIRTLGNNRLALFASDGTTVQKVYCGAKIDVHGCVLLDAQTLYSLIPLLSPERMDFYPTEYDGKSAMGIRCGAAKARLAVKITADEFSFPPEPTGQFLGSADYKMLKPLVGHLYRFRNSQSHNDYEKAVFLCAAGHTLTLMATNGYGVARATLPLDTIDDVSPVSLRLENAALYTAIQSMLAEKAETIGFHFDNATKTLFLCSERRDVQLEVAECKPHVLTITPLLYAMLGNLSTVVRFLKSYKGKYLHIENRELALRNGNDSQQTQTAAISEPMPYMSIHPDTVPLVYQTVQLLKSWGESCSISSVRWNEKLTSLELTGSNGDYQLECWFSTHIEKPTQT